MSGRPWYKRCGADFIEGTMGLSLEEKGAYSLLLDLIYSHGGPIADDARWLAGICSVSVRKWNSLRDRLIEAGKIVIVDGRISNPRADKELIISQKSHDNLSESGAKGGRKSAENKAAAKENNDLAQAGLKQEREDKRREEEDPSGRDASKDVRKTLFDDGVKVLCRRAGLPDRKARALIAKWLKDADDDAGKVLAKIRQAEADDVGEMIAWVTKAVQPQKRSWRDEPEYRGVDVNPLSPAEVERYRAMGLS